MTTAQYIEIRNASDKPVAFLSPQADGVKGAYIDNELNGNCSLVFELPANSEKWAYITDAYEFLVDGRRFILIKPDTEEIVRDGQKVWGKVTAQEKWVELDKEYVTISNDPNSVGPAWATVIIVSGGTPAGGYAAGSAGSALTYLLAGSGWTVGTVDVTGTFDLETERLSILANIQKVQKLWGGNLVWDSENKTVSLRDETLWQNYTGFQVRYAKNLKGITRTVNRDLVTRLYPFGYEDLNIGSVNGGVLYLDNFTHTTKVLIAPWVNQDITDATELKTKATTELAKLCKPRYTYSMTILDLRTLPGYTHETFAIGDMADVIDPDVSDDERLRIIRHKYYIFQPWKCELDVGEPLEKLSSRISDVSAVTDKVLTNSGTANLFKGLLNTAATEINGASGDYTLIDGVSTWYGSTGGVRDGKVTRITPNGLIISDDGGQTWETAIDGSGIYGNKVIASDLYALASDDGYTKMGSAGISVMDGSSVIKAFLGQYATGKFGLKLYDGDIQIGNAASRVLINPTDGFKIQKYSEEAWADQFYADVSGNIVYAGNLSGASGTLGTITGGSLTIGNSAVRTLINTSGFDLQTKIGADWKSHFSVDTDGNLIVGGSATGFDPTTIINNTYITNTSVSNTTVTNTQIVENTTTVGYLEMTSSVAKIRIDPTDGIKISKKSGASWVDQMYLDVNGAIQFSNDVRIQFKGDTGATGAQGPQGNPGSYYAPAWVQATYIDLSQVASPKIIAGNAYLHDALVVGADGDNMAGISGVGITSSDVRFWAGATYANRATAPFRVTQGGQVVLKSIKSNDSQEWQVSIDEYGQVIQSTSISSLRKNTVQMTGYVEIMNDTYPYITKHAGVLDVCAFISNSVSLGQHLYPNGIDCSYANPFIFRPNHGIGIDWEPSSDTSKQYVGILGSLNIGSTYYNQTPLTNGLRVEGQSKLYGNVGIGCEPDDYGLHVNGTGAANTFTANTVSCYNFWLAQTTQPSSPNAGQLYFDGTNIKAYIGGTWKTVV